MSRTSELSDIDLVRHILVDLHDDLDGRVRRLRHLLEVGATGDQSGTMIFGGQPAAMAYLEVRSSFVVGNFIATVLLCQSLLENTFAGFLHATFAVLPGRITYKETLKRLHARGLLDDADEADLMRLLDLRNPLSHYRNIDDKTNLDRRSITTDHHAVKILEADAFFAIGVVARTLGKPPFQVGPA